MILWLNSPFGVGKTTIARSMRERVPAWQVFDPKSVGLLLAANLAGVDFDDFQDLPPWRALLPLIGSEISEFTGDDVLVVQTVLRQEYWEEMETTFRERQHMVVHVLLDASAAVLEARITQDTDERTAQKWRLDHVRAYASARSWLGDRADLVVDTEFLSAPDSASFILGSLPQLFAKG